VSRVTQPGPEPELTKLLADPGQVTAVPPERVPILLAQLAALQSALAARLLVADAGRRREPPPDDGRLLTAEEAAKILGVTPRWLYRQQRLPFVRRLSRKALRVSETSLRAWLASRGRDTRAGPR
jgi:predicted DNA-binding transcriptional regulator AlpA